MKPVRFDEANKNLTKPADMSDEECSSLPVFNDGTVCVSCWELSDDDKKQLLETGKLWLSVHSGVTQPPVLLTVNKGDVL